MANFPNAQNMPAGAIPVYIATGPTGAGLVPSAGLVTTVTTGGTAVTAVGGFINGGYIANPPNTASQGIATAENLYISLVGTPGSTDASANGTTFILAAGNSFNLPSLSSGVSVKVNAATSGHKFTLMVW